MAGSFKSVGDTSTQSAVTTILTIVVSPLWAGPVLNAPRALSDVVLKATLGGRMPGVQTWKPALRVQAPAPAAESVSGGAGVRAGLSDSSPHLSTRPSRERTEGLRAKAGPAFPYLVVPVAWEADPVLIPILQKRKLRPREVTCPWSHRWQVVEPELTRTSL